MYAVCKSAMIGGGLFELSSRRFASASTKDGDLRLFGGVLDDLEANDLVS